jgi:hypothetical protein
LVNYSRTTNIRFSWQACIVKFLRASLVRMLSDNEKMQCQYLDLMGQ